MEINGPGTIDDLLQDAERQGHSATTRLVTDWVSLGLLDKPTRRPQGRGRGSAKGLYSANQRQLFLALLDKRAEGAHRIRTLTRLPIFVWLDWDDHVPTRQALIVLTQWAKKSFTSLEGVADSAEDMVKHIGHPLAQKEDRRELQAVLAEIGYQGRIDDLSRLDAAVRQVFEPSSVFRQDISRAVGHPSTPMTARGVVELLHARAEGVIAFRKAAVTATDMERARQMYRTSRDEYTAMVPTLRAETPPPYRALYADDSLQSRVDRCVVDLLTLVGILKLQAGLSTARPLAPR
ncbi:hypothetical protein ACQPZJ_05255 [Actinoplanes sp. CA-054009]